MIGDIFSTNFMYNDGGIPHIASEEATMSSQSFHSNDSDKRRRLSVESIPSLDKHRFSSLDDSDDDSDTEEDEGESRTLLTTSSRSSGGKTRPSVKEHSKAQREKRKRFVNSLEGTAQKLVDNINLARQKAEEDCEMLKILHETYRNQLQLLMQLLFDTTFIKKTSNEIDVGDVNIWGEVLETTIKDSENGFQVTIPDIPFVHMPPAAFEGGRRTIDSLHQISAFACGWRQFACSIARLCGNLCRSLEFGLKLSSGSQAQPASSSNLATGAAGFIVHGRMVSAEFELISENGLVVGESDVSIRGMIFAKFSKIGDGDKISRLDVFFDVEDLYQKIKVSFGNNVVDNNLQGYFFPSSPSRSFNSNLIQFDTTMLCLGPFMVTNRVTGEQSSMEQLLDMDNSLVGKSIAFKCMSWRPFYYYLSVDSNHSSDDRYFRREFLQLLSMLVCIPDLMSGNFFVEIVPFNDQLLSACAKNPLFQETCGPLNVATIQPPNRLFWQIRRCELIRLDSFMPIFIVNNICDKMIRKYYIQQDASDSSDVHEPSVQRHERVEMLMTQGKTPMITFTKLLQKILNIKNDSCMVIGRLHELYRYQQNENEHIQDSDVAKNIFAILANFVKFMTGFEKKFAMIVESNVATLTLQSLANREMNGQTDSEKDTSTEGSDKSDKISVASNRSGDNNSATLFDDSEAAFMQNMEEIKQILSIHFDFSLYFSELRKCDHASRSIVALYKVPVSDENDIKMAEQFLFLIWTKHPSLQVQQLMKTAKNHIIHRKYAEALATLSEVIAIDPTYPEALNKRATVYFGLKRAKECFRDIYQVLLLEPNHYGALCGQALMLMKLGKYAAALQSFERAISINPHLRNSSLDNNMATCRTACLQNGSMSSSASVGSAAKGLGFLDNMDNISIDRSTYSSLDGSF